MNTYWFQVELKFCPLSLDDLAEQGFEAGCDDGTFSEVDGVTLIGFAREAKSLDDAVGSAIRQLETIGCVIAKIVIDDSASTTHAT